MTTLDKHSKELYVGTTVEIVYGGEHHTLVIESLSEEHGHHYVHGSVNVKLPASAVSRRNDLTPKDVPKDGSRVHVQEHKADVEIQHTYSEQTTHKPPKR